jgi:hypothetical protein
MNAELDHDETEGSAGTPLAGDKQGVADTATPAEPADPDPRRTDHERRRGMRIAPPSMKVDRLPDPLVTDDERPQTVREAAETYLKVQRSNWDSEAYTSAYERARGTYAGLLDADRQCRQEYDGLTTVLVTRRLSPLDDEGEWLEPLAIESQLHDEAARRSFTRALRYQLRSYDYEYAAITATTESAATPHEHVYLWIDDPEDAIGVEHFEPAVEKHVARVPNAHEDDHQIQAEGNHGAVTIRHDPPLVDHVPDAVEDDIEQIRAHSEAVGADESVPVNTAGAQYLASQLPHLVLSGVYDGTVDVHAEDARVDGAAIAWASQYNWLRSSHGLSITA